MLGPRCALLAIALGCFVLIPAGCGGTDGNPAGISAPTKGVSFVAFDVSTRLLEALQDGTLQGTVAQNPYKMGRLGVKAVVDALENRPMEAKITTGETLVTPENLTRPEVEAVLHPPRVDHRADAVRSGAKAKKWRVMVIPKGTTHEFWQSVHAGASQGAAESGDVEIIWQGPAREDDRTEQIKLIQGAVASGVDGIVLAPLDAKALVEPVEQAIAKGIKVVIFDSGLESDKISSFVATDNYHGGILAAKRLGEILGGKGRIILLRYAVGSASTDERERGFTDTIKREFPGVTYLSDDQYSGATSDLAQQKAQNLITRFRGQIDGIFCPNESSAVGMLRALEGAGMLARRP